MDDDTRYPVDLREGLQLDVGRNVVQLIATLSCASIGVIAGFLIATPRDRWAGTTMLGVIGAIIGISASGLWYMFCPPKPSALTINELREVVHDRERRIRVLSRALVITGVCLCGGCLLFSPRTSAWGGACIGALFVLAIGGKVSLGLMRAAIESIRCPVCASHFSRCEHCHAGE